MPEINRATGPLRIVVIKNRDSYILTGSIERDAFWQNAIETRPVGDAQATCLCIKLIER
ncbi:hypothetical protein [Spirosoma areae]